MLKEIIIFLIQGRFMDDITSDEGLTYRTICNFPVSITNLTRKEIKDCAESAVFIMVGLGVLTETFDRSHDFYNMKKLMNDPIAISIGALFLKLIIMTKGKPLTIDLIDPTDLYAFLRETINKDEVLTCSSLDSLSTMSVRGCIPNAIFIRTRDFLCTWHSIQPIRKGDKIVYLDSDSTIYCNSPKATRLLASRGSPNYPCDCRACKEDWPHEDTREGVEAVAHEDPDIKKQMMNELNSYAAENNSISPLYMNPDMKTMTKVKDLLLRAWKHYILPSTTITRAVRAFWETSTYFYGQSIYDYK
ncbi:hypothetical protein QAD02_001271 [Eretmocerus hayati]|uniref:Uncharacterized protein n=1 Tax=Eretmocerus hayati TaxID=131215 RepID=A0ACC2NFZ7_9HYME|nr:hypothetical protein QAD02_001271 [Eretmocerus hayati]